VKLVEQSEVILVNDKRDHLVKIRYVRKR